MISGIISSSVSSILGLTIEIPLILPCLPLNPTTPSPPNSFYPSMSVQITRDTKSASLTI
jgi:hypothetical protein